MFQSGAVSTPITMGSDYTIIGTIDQFNGKAEIIPSDPANDITDNGTGTLPDALEMTVDALLADPETYEGMLVKIFNLDSVDGTWGGNSNITVNDGTGSMLFFIDIDTDVDESTEGTYPVDIVGIFGQYDTSSPYDDGYQIMPRFATDLTWSPSAIEPVSHAGLNKEFRLYPNFPNPFNPSTTLQFDVPKYTDHLELGIYNISGQKVKNLYAGSVKQGRFEYKWNGTNDFNQNLPSGVYFAVLKTTGFSQTIKMMLIK